MILKKQDFNEQTKSSRIEITIIRAHTRTKALRDIIYVEINRVAESRRPCDTQVAAFNGKIACVEHNVHGII